MKKKLKLATLAMCVMLPVASILAACDNHEHIMDSAWSQDASYHWHACMMDSCDVISNKSAHTFGDWIVDKEATISEEGQKHRKCSTCHYYDYAVISFPDSVGLEFELNEDGESYSLKGMGTCTDEVVVVPSAYEGKPVIAVGDNDYYRNNSDNVKKIILPSSIVRLDYDAFYYYDKLEEISLPNSITSIGASAFAYCSKLKSITLPNSVTNVGKNTFINCNSLVSVRLSSSMEAIPEGMFNNCRSLESISIPSNIKSIGASAFYYTGIKNIVIPNSVETIEEAAFHYCLNLSSITFPSGLTTINANTFNNCSSLKSINIPDSVTSVYYNTFYKCTSLENVTIGKNTQFIIPSKPYYRCFNHFDECIVLKSFTVHSENPYYKVVDGSLYSKDGKILYVYAHGKNDTTFTVPDGVETIGDHSFLKTNNLTSVILPNSVKYIGMEAFASCKNLESITIGTGVEVIGREAFLDCEKFATINYLGTETQWDAIIKGKDPDYPEEHYKMGTYVTPFPSLDSDNEEDVEE